MFITMRQCEVCECDRNWSSALLQSGNNRKQETHIFYLPGLTAVGLTGCVASNGENNAKMRIQHAQQLMTKDDVI